MAGLDAVIVLIQRSGIRGEIWIDGSFLTEKLNPDDVDLCLVVSAQVFLAFTPGQRQFFDWYKANNLKAQYRCDNYWFVRDDQNAECVWMNAYWLRQFGFSRGDAMKGLAVISVPSLVTP